MIKPISREEEANLPTFKDAEEAYRYFKNLYGKDFAFQKIENAGDGQKYWYCHLIIDRPVYEQGMRTLASMETATGLDFLKSFQTVEIMESGHVHIVH